MIWPSSNRAVERFPPTSSTASAGDIADGAQLERLWAEAGEVDAVVCVAGEVPYARIEELGPQDYPATFSQKAVEGAATGQVITLP